MAHPASEFDRLDQAAALLRARGAGDAGLAVVLGSGLKRFADTLADRVEIGFAAIPHWPVPKVEGHGGALVLGRIGATRVACLTGRVHLYEGWEPAEVVRAVRSLALAGVPRFLLTNAAGGIGTHLAAGDLMRIRDHLNLTGRTPLLGAHDPRLGPRFPDLTEVYSPRLAALLDVADPGLKSGVYAGLLGPSYETPAEIRWLRTIGADAVGMSTVAEAIALKALGAEVAGVSLISNLAAGIAAQPLRHDEVIAAGAAAESRFGALIAAFAGAIL